jgi:tRNA-dihydrouridine synthase A
MAEPELVSACVTAMLERVDVPVTVKCRIGIDDANERDMLFKFIETVAGGGCETFVVHARKAWLKGLSPRENREVPPLNYELVRDLRREFPDLKIILNGGIQTIEDIQAHLKNFDGVMLGRTAYQNPGLLQDIETALYGTISRSLVDIIEKMIAYADDQKTRFGTPLHAITRHMVGLNGGRPGARRWRQILSVDAHQASSARDALIPALKAVSESLELVA